MAPLAVAAARLALLLGRSRRPVPCGAVTSPAVCVVGLGKIGLALAAQYASRGLRVNGADIDSSLVALIEAGTPPVGGEEGLAERLAAARSNQLLSATTDTAAAVASSSVVVIVVPLLVDGEGVPDFRALDAATDAIARGLQPGTTVIYETTLPVGTTRERFTPKLASTGLVPGENLFVAFSPERVFVGRTFADLRRYPKLVGGIDDASTAKAIEFYERALEFDERPDLARLNGVWNLGTAEAAELAKLAETTYRDINIGFANELARFSERSGIDVFKVIEAANSQPFSHIHLPGVAVGGHCIPVYPRLYLTNDPGALVPAAARATNLAMPLHVVERLTTAHGSLEGQRVVVLGAAYRGGVKETAFSGVFPLVDHLRAAGAIVSVHDPLYNDAELGRFGLEPYHFGEPCDAAVVQCDHVEYAAMRPSDLPGITTLIDGRRITTPSDWQGVRHLQVGIASV